MKRATNGRPYVGVRAGCPASVAGKFFGEFKRGLFSKSPLLRAPKRAFLFVSFFFAPALSKKKRVRKLMTEWKE